MSKAGVVKRCANLWLRGDKNFEAADLTLSLNKLEMLELCYLVAMGLETDELEHGGYSAAVQEKLLEMLDGTTHFAEIHRKPR